MVGRVGHQVTWETTVAFEQRAWRKPIDVAGAARRILAARKWASILSASGAHLEGGRAGLLPPESDVEARARELAGVPGLELSNAVPAPSDGPRLPDVMVAKRTVTVSFAWSVTMENDVLQPGGTIVNVLDKVDEWESISA